MWSTSMASPSLPGVNGRLVLTRPAPMMMRTVWGDAARYEKDWQEIANTYITGDLAMKDEDGYISVIGRADDVSMLPDIASARQK